MKPAWYAGLLETGRIPDMVVRRGIRRLLRRRLQEQSQGGVEQQTARLAALVDQLRHSPVALHSDAQFPPAMPIEFFRIILGPYLKHSCAWWPTGIDSLADAERSALHLTCERARIADGDRVLDLGSGWGAFALYAAQRFPNSQVTGVVNSEVQKAYIDIQAERCGLHNLEIVLAGMNEFRAQAQYDRIVSIETFERLRNYRLVLERIHRWTSPRATLFVQVFAHHYFAYPFEADDPSDWLARHFFPGALMPSEDLLLHFQEHFHIRDHWVLDGTHYRRTVEAWLSRLDDRHKEVLALFKRTYGEKNGRLWLVRWRVFLMVCAELWGYHGGQEWIVSHYLFERLNHLPKPAGIPRPTAISMERSVSW